AYLLPDFATPAGPAAPSSYRTGRRGRVSFRPASEMNPADAAMCSETKAMLMNMIRTLDHRHREPFLLYHFDGLTVREIANKLNLPASNIQARVRRASEKLRCLLFS